MTACDSQPGAPLAALKRPEDIDPSFVVGSTRLGRMFKRGRLWGHRQLKEWMREQERGGPVRVFRRANGQLFTTVGIVDFYLPRARRDEAMERRLRIIEHDLETVFARIAECERRMGRRR